MRILLVEDKVTFAQQVEKSVAAIHGCELVWAKSRDAAFELLKEETFDLVILDRRIPTQEGQLDDHPDHGWAVFQFVKEETPGTPVWFLTGTEDTDFAADLNNLHGRAADLHGTAASESMYLVFWKRRMTDALKKLREFAEQRRLLDAVALDGDAEKIGLNADEQRVLRLFARRRGGSSASVLSLNGGYSNSRVLKVGVQSPDGRLLLTAAVKVAAYSETNAEVVRFHDHIDKLVPGGFPQILETVSDGTGRVSGVFYGLVGGGVQNAFDRIAADPGGCSTIPPQVRAIQQPWHASAKEINVSVAQVRRQLVGDVTLARLKGVDDIPLKEVEAKRIVVNEASQHGDMHGANVVFGPDGRPMLIDFGDTKTSFAALDPITLELSLAFHSQRSVLPGVWPSVEAMGHWPDLDAYVVDCPYENFVRECRAWALGVAGSQQECLALAYAYGLRQFKYEDTSKEHAKALVIACISALSK